MFTGIIRKLAPVTRITRRGPGARIAVDLGELAAAAEHGDSICINGICLTVAEKAGTVCEFDAVAETLSRSTLGELRPGDNVNVEPSLRVGDQLGGHFVLGHVDGIGVITGITPVGEGVVMKVSEDAALAAQMVPKGSVAVDGVSLTVVDVAADYFTCALIPTTLKDTTLAANKLATKVNIETDILGKLVARRLGRASGPSDLTLEKLKEAGFA